MIVCHKQNLLSKIIICTIYLIELTIIFWNTYISHEIAIIPDTNNYLNWDSNFDKFDSILESLAYGNGFILYANFLGLVGSTILNAAITILLIISLTNILSLLFGAFIVLSPFWIQCSIGPSKEIFLFILTYLFLINLLNKKSNISSLIILILILLIRPGYALILSIIFFLKNKKEKFIIYLGLICLIFPTEIIFNIMSEVDFGIFNHWLTIQENSVIAENEDAGTIKTLIINLFYNILRFDDYLLFHYLSMGILINISLIIFIKDRKKITAYCFLIACMISLVSFPHSRYIFPLVAGALLILKNDQNFNLKKRNIIIN